MIKKSGEKSFPKDHFERLAWAENRVVIGIDEVGRGCLSGPVVAAALSLKQGLRSSKLKDSKTLNRAQLFDAYDWILCHAIVSVGISSSWVVDQINIYRATQEAMQLACAGLLTQLSDDVSTILVDAMPLSLPANFPQVIHFPKGERKSSSIAGASIVAKVVRDRLIEEMGYAFPSYKLDQHKGYGTATHRTALQEAGKSLIHRFTFHTSEDAIDEQMPLFG